jgi:Transposase DDE domain group 1
MADDAPFLPGLSPVAGKPVHLSFDAGRLTSDGGVLMLAEIERRLGIADRLARCIEDPRAPDRVEHGLAEPGFPGYLFPRPTLPPSSAPGKAAGVGTWAGQVSWLRRSVFSSLRPALWSRLSSSRSSMAAPRPSGCLRSLLRMLMPEAALVAVGADRSDA